MFISYPYSFEWGFLMVFSNFMLTMEIVKSTLSWRFRVGILFLHRKLDFFKNLCYFYSIAELIYVTL